MKEFKRCTRLKDVPTTTSDRTKAPLGTCPAPCSVESAVNKAFDECASTVGDYWSYENAIRESDAETFYNRVNELLSQNNHLHERSQ